jgi:CPA2 family monovalent cation:H+ antiporter-2
VGADVLPFREAFQVLFFVSVGMLVNPIFLWNNLGQVAALTFLVVVGKAVVTLLMGLLFKRPARTFLVVAVGLSQIGEFSFIIGQGGMSLGLLDANQYSLILAASLLSITVNPAMYWLMPHFEKLLRRLPGFWRRLDQSVPLPIPKEEELDNHVVIIGYGRVGRHLVDVLESLDIPQLVIETDAERIDELNRRKTMTLYGDAANSEVITHAGLERARALIVTIPEESSASMIVLAARRICPDLPIIVRAATEDGVRHLAEMGANHIVHPELEGGLELVHHTLLQLGFPLRQVHAYSEAVRRDRYDYETRTDEEHRSLQEMLNASEGIEISWIRLEVESWLVGQTLAEADLRSKSGASVVAVIRDGKLTANPKSYIKFIAGDRLGMIGEDEQIEQARQLVLSEEPEKKMGDELEGELGEELV